MAICRFCAAPLKDVVVDLGTSPLSNSYVPPGKLSEMEPFFPLKVWFCGGCGLVQLEEFATPGEIFSRYDYFSSYSDSWLRHARDYVQFMTEQYGIGRDSQVVEIASNDGYLLQYFLERGVKALGVEPAVNVAAVAKAKGIPTETAFFGRETAANLVKRGFAADLALGNNVLAHVPDINDFVAGFATLLKPGGIMTVEFPHLLNLIRGIQFDTIYHEHFSYLSLHTVQRIFRHHGLTVFDVRELPAHGGSLRVFAAPAGAGRAPTEAVETILRRELDARLDQFSGFRGFAGAAEEIKYGLLEFLLRAKRGGKRVAAYGAAAKGNTLLNYAGIHRDLIAMVADRSPAKQGKFLPGSRIPVASPEELLASRPDYVLILPWNLREEIMEQLAAVREWGGRFVTAVPRMEEWR